MNMESTDKNVYRLNSLPFKGIASFCAFTNALTAKSSLWKYLIVLALIMPSTEAPTTLAFAFLLSGYLILFPKMQINTDAVIPRIGTSIFKPMPPAKSLTITITAGTKLHGKIKQFTRILV